MTSHEIHALLHGRVITTEDKGDHWLTTMKGYGAIATRKTDADRERAEAVARISFANELNMSAHHRRRAGLPPTPPRRGVLGPLY